jgi:hypothetical protein
MRTAILSSEVYIINSSENEKIDSYNRDFALPTVS